MDLRTAGEYDAGESLTQDGTPVSTHALSHLPMSVNTLRVTDTDHRWSAPHGEALASMLRSVQKKPASPFGPGRRHAATAAEVRRAGDERRDAFSDDETVLAHRAIRRVMTSRQSGDAAASWCMYLRARVSASGR